MVPGLVLIANSSQIARAKALQPGSAVLSRNGTVKVNGARVGFWWVWPDIRLYHFDFARPDDEARAPGVVTNTFRHFFKAQIPEYLARMGKLPIDGRMEGGTR